MARADDREREGEREGDQNRPTPAGRLESAPKVTVLGYMNGNIALRLHWKHGMHVVSNSRFKFMREELEMAITDDPDEYLF